MSAEERDFYVTQRQVMHRDGADLRRGETAWHMPLDLLELGHRSFGFDYPMSGDSEQYRKVKGFLS